MLDTYLKWFQSHERTIALVLVLAAGIYGLNRWLDKSTADADTKAAAAAQVSAVQDAASKQLAAQSAQQMALFTQQIIADKQELASLVAAMASRDAASSKKVAEVTGVKTPAQAIANLSTTYTLAAPVTVTADGADVPTVDLQQFTVAKIEGDTAKANLVDTRTELVVTQKEVASCQTVVGTLQKQTAQDVVDLKAHDDKAAADIKKVKADARKGKWHTFWWGVAAGFVGRQAIKVGTGF